MNNLTKFWLAWLQFIFYIQYFLMSVVFLLMPQFAQSFLPNHANKENCVLITGTSSGIGKATALHLAKLGFTVFAGVRNLNDGKAVSNELDAEAKGALVPIIIDVTQESSIQSCLKQVEDYLLENDGSLIALINNAGVIDVQPMELVSPEAMDNMYNVNIKGILRVTQTFLPILRESGWASRIVNIGSLNGDIAGMGFYAVTKYAVRALTDTLRQELAEQGISVSLVVPGATSSAKMAQYSKVSPNDKRAKFYSAELATFAHLKKHNDDANDPILTVYAIEHAITAKFPKPVYRTTPEHLGVEFINSLPTRVADALKKKIKNSIVAEPRELERSDRFVEI